ncbi:MAG: hypothetical protein ACOH1H_13975 [Brevundimonas sp.]
MVHHHTSISLPSDISSSMATEAFHHVFDLTDWRLRVSSLDPITVRVEHDEVFLEYVASAGSWRTRDRGRAWVANRVLELTDAIDKTFVRRLSLQHPHSMDDGDTGLFLDHLHQRIKDTIRTELRSLFDTSIQQWESDVRDFVGGDDDPTARNALLFYVGLDQVVSVDDARKAVKAVFTRMHWYLDGEGRSLKLVPDHRFDTIQTRRGGHDDRTRARSLVARGIQVLVDDNVSRIKDGQNVAEMSRTYLRDAIQQRFDRDGVWGLIDLVIAVDRRGKGTPLAG